MARIVNIRVAPIVIVLVGSLLILPRLGTQSLWLDEGLTVGPVLRATGLSDLVAEVRHVDTQPPGSHFVLYEMRDLLPRSEFGLRLPSFVAIEVGLGVFCLLIWRLWDGPTAVVALALAQFSSYLAFFAAEARNYAFWFLVIVASWLLGVLWHERAAAGRRSLALALAWGVVNGLGLWLHLFHVFVILGECVVVLVIALLRFSGVRARAGYLAGAVLAQGVAVAAVTPWLVILAHGSAEGHAAGVAWTRSFSLGNVFYYLYAFHFGASYGPDLRELHSEEMRDLVARYWMAFSVAAAAIATTFAVYAALVAGAVRCADRRFELLVLVLFPLATLLGPLAYALLTGFPLHPRHMLFAWPLLPIVLALGIVRMPRLRPLLALVVVAQLVAFGNQLFDPHYWKDDERGAISFAEEHSGNHAYVLGDLASIYCRRVDGRDKNFVDFLGGTQDVWLVDNRAWEPENQRLRSALERRLKSLGFHDMGVSQQFRGIALRHWQWAESS